jgi:hypothetical protein
MYVAESARIYRSYPVPARIVNLVVRQPLLHSRCLCGVRNYVPPSNCTLGAVLLFINNVAYDIPLQKLHKAQIWSRMHIVTFDQMNTN